MAKQFMIVEVVRDIGTGVAELIPSLGLLTFEAAQQIVSKAMKQNPKSTLAIQEVGTA